MRTLHKIYLFVILICIIVYNLYNVSKKNKEGFFFGYSPIFDWNRPLELPKKEAEEQKKEDGNRIKIVKCHMKSI